MVIWLLGAAAAAAAVLLVWLALDSTFGAQDWGTIAGSSANASARREAGGDSVPRS